MTEQQQADVTRTLDVLVERIGGLATRVGDMHESLNRRMDDMHSGLNQRIDDLRSTTNARFDDMNKLSVWLRGLLVAIALLLAKIAFFPG